MFDDLLKRIGLGRQVEKPVQEQPTVLVPDGTISYKPALVADLLSDHQDLLRMFQELVASHKKGDFDACVAKLKAFADILRSHLLKENLHLYVYLKHSLQHDPESSELMKSMRTEMGTIGRTLNRFVTRYTTTPWDAQTRAALGSELESIADVLVRRIAQEEKLLYPMYMPPSSYR